MNELEQLQAELVKLKARLDQLTKYQQAVQTKIKTLEHGTDDTTEHKEPDNKG